MIKEIFKGIVSTFALVALVFCIGCDGIQIENKSSHAYIPNDEIGGRSTNCAVVLVAEQGISYTAKVYTDDNWAHFSNNATITEGEITIEDGQVLYVYFSKNDTESERTAEITIDFSDGRHFRGFFSQGTYDATIVFEREWMELPVCKDYEDYIYHTHYGEFGTRTDARNYTYCFSPTHRAACWVAYPLHSKHISGSGNRNNSKFKYDPDVDSQVQANMGAGSYVGSYDRGHQLPAADRKCSQEMMDQTFYATNMTPQQANFNQKKWATLENMVRKQVSRDTVYVVTGAYFAGIHDSSIKGETYDKSGNICPTPTYYFKALLRSTNGNESVSFDQITDASRLRSVAIWMKHENSGENTTIADSEFISVEELESLTGFEFFPMLDDSIEQEVKSQCSPALWR